MDIDGRPGFTRRQTVGALSVGAAIAATPAGAARDVSHAGPELWYRRPAAEWNEALPVGNGRIGAMLFGQVRRDRLQLNEHTLWGGGPYDPVNPRAKASMAALRQLIWDGKYAEAEVFANANVMATPLRQASYKPVGDLTIEMLDHGGEASDYRRSLDLDAALADVRYRIGGTEYRRDLVASGKDQVLAYRLSASRRRAIRCRLSMTCPQKTWAVAVSGDDTLVLSGRNDPEGANPGALRFEARVKLVPVGGTLRRDGDGIVVDGASELLVLIAMATSYRRFDDVTGDPAALTTARIAAAARRSFDAIAADTAEAHRRLFRRVAIDLGRPSPAIAAMATDERIVASPNGNDPTLAALYFDYARYLLLSCSRPGGQAANLQGLWNESPRPPWGSKYTVNINTQMNYWPAEPTALDECVEPLIAMVRDIAITGERTARTMYGARGWVCHHNTDLWRATAPIDGAKFGLWPTGGAWLCTHLWSRYDYGRDIAYLRSIYPIMRGAALFFIDTLQTDPKTGRLVTNPSLSPENGHGHGSSLIQGPTMDMDILRDLFDQVVAAAGILNTDAEFARQVTATRERLLPHRIGKDGQLQEWIYDWDADANDPHHRHVSHLYGLYPGNQIDPDRTPELAGAARRSLEIRGDKATGWATAWRINLWARLRDGDRAHSILTFLLGPERTYPNMFDAHPPFQIDGNFGGAAGIANMLMQARGDLIHVLPALPRAWPTGSIAGLRAPDRCSVDVSWQGGRLDRVRLTAQVAGRRSVRLGDRTMTVDLPAGRPVVLTGRAFDRGAGA